MAEMNTSSWKEFRLDELFDNPIRGTRLVKEQRIAGDIPLITAGFTNQGVAGFISNEEQKTFNGGLTIDMFGNCFFRDYVFKADDNILVFDSEDISKEAVCAIGAELEKSERFPDGINTQIIRIADKNNIYTEVYERGAGYTLATGSGCCAAAGVAYQLGLTDPCVYVHMPGGTLTVRVEEDMSAHITGWADCIGRIILSDEFLRKHRIMTEA